MCFCNSVFVNFDFLAISFVGCQIHFDKFFFFLHNGCCSNERSSIVTVDDLDFGIKEVTFETKMFNKYHTFDRIANRSMEDLGYAYLHCDLLERVALTTIILKVKSPHIDMHEQYL